MKTKTVRNFLKQHMAANCVDDFGELAKLTGIKYQTLLDHVAQPGLFRKYEFNSICEALSLTSDDVLEFHSLTE